MTLANWLKSQALNQGAFAAKIGATQTAVSRYCSGKRIPPRHIMRRIVEVTDGAVTPNDFYGVDGAASRQDAA